jgi:hypothetical protein
MLKKDSEINQDQAVSSSKSSCSLQEVFLLNRVTVQSMTVTVNLVSVVLAPVRRQYHLVAEQGLTITLLSA